MATTIDKVQKMIRSALELLEKISTTPESEKIEKAEKIVEAAATVSAGEGAEGTEVTEGGTVVAAEPLARRNGELVGDEGINRSEKIRDYFTKHGMAVRNKEVIDYIKKTYNTEVGPAHVSIIRKNMSSGKTVKAKAKATTKAKATIKAKTKAKVKAKSSTKVSAKVKGDLGKLPMGTLCASLLKKHGSRDGLKLSELTDLVIKSGYPYKGDKGRDGVLQNVYQALHSLSREGSHAGYKGETPVIVKDPASKRYKLNPKAKVQKVA